MGVKHKKNKVERTYPQNDRRTSNMNSQRQAAIGKKYRKVTKKVERQPHCRRTIDVNRRNGANNDKKQAK